MLNFSKTYKLTLLFSTASLLCAFSVSAETIKTIHVSPSGNDAADGSQASPLATLHAAQQLARASRSQAGDIEIVIGEGEYYLDKMLHLTNEDSAPKGSYTIFKAAEGAEVLISGGKKIEGWEKLAEAPEHLPAAAKDKVWVAKLDWLTPETRFHALMKDETFLPRARSGAINAFSKGLKPYQHGHLDNWKYRVGFHYKPGNVKLREWENMDDIEVYTQPWKQWLVNYLTVEKVDLGENYVSFKSPATYSMGQNPAFIENAIDFLDQAGEWCINTQEQKLYYWPKSGNKPEEGLIATYLDEVVRVEGQSDASLEGANEKPVNGIVFEGLTFSHADRQRWEVDDIGIQHDWDMWDKDSGMIRFRSAENCRVSDCKFVNTGSGGVRLDLYSQNITVEKSYFKNLGGVGVVLAGYGPWP